MSCESGAGASFGHDTDELGLLKAKGLIEEDGSILVQIREWIEQVTSQSLRGGSSSLAASRLARVVYRFFESLVLSSTASLDWRMAT